MMRAFAIATALLLLGAACGGGVDDDASRVVSSPSPDASASPEVTADPASPSPEPRSTARVTSPTSAPTPQPSGLETVQVKLTRVATVQRPVVFAVRQGDDRTYVAEQTGRVRVLRGGDVVGTALDLSGEVTTSGNEQGLLGLAFSPDGRYLYVNFTGAGGDTVVRAYRMSGAQADTSTAAPILEVDQPAANHNGGNLVFGPDGFLYIGLGDGGRSGDPWENAQDTSVLLGKMLRIDPDPSGGYDIPSDNPFVGRDGADEIWAYGLRNPWRYSFDRDTGDLYIGDVGQNAWEEVDFQPASSDGGENYGWDQLEGTHRYEGPPPPNDTLPIYEYARDDGNCAVTGGYVYRGDRIPDLQGAYVFADYCGGRLRAFRTREGAATGHRFLGPRTAQITSFGEDRNGELYVLSREGGIFRIDPA